MDRENTDGQKRWVSLCVYSAVSSSGLHHWKRMFRDMNMGGQALEQPFCVWKKPSGEVSTAPGLSVVQGRSGNALNNTF